MAGIVWDKPAQEIYNLVRGCDPQPGAYVFRNGEKVRFYGPKFVTEKVDAAPGTIFHVNDRGIHVAVSGGRLIIGKARAVSGGKVPAADLAADRGLKPGDQFGTQY